MINAREQNLSLAASLSTHNTCCEFEKSCWDKIKMIFKNIIGSSRDVRQWINYGHTMISLWIHPEHKLALHKGVKTYFLLTDENCVFNLKCHFKMIFDQFLPWCLSLKRIQVKCSWDNIWVFSFQQLEPWTGSCWNPSFFHYSLKLQLHYMKNSPHNKQQTVRCRLTIRNYLRAWDRFKVSKVFTFIVIWYSISSFNRLQFWCRNVFTPVDHSWRVRYWRMTSQG